jgi:hypothetical protein
MVKNPTDRVKDSFTGDDRESIAKYLEWSRLAILDYSQALRRSATIQIITIAAFELVAYSKNQKISLGSFELARNSIVLTFLPAIVAYLFFQITTDHNRIDQLTTMYFAAFRLWSEKSEGNDLDTPILGPAPLYWNTFRGRYQRNNMYRYDRIENVGSGIIMIIVFFWRNNFRSPSLLHTVHR